MTYIDRTNISLGTSSTTLNLVWEGGFKTPLNSVRKNGGLIQTVKYRVYGLQVDYSTTQSVVINTGYCYSDDYLSRISTSSTLTVSFANSNGALGLDTGTKQNSTWYYLFVIKNTSNTVSAIFSASSTSPTLPSGYIYKKLIGVVRVDGSGDIVQFNSYGKGSRKEIVYDSFNKPLAAGTSTSYSNISMTTLIPNEVTRIGLFGIFLYLSGGSTASGTWEGYLRNPNASVAGLRVKTCVTNTFAIRGSDTVVNGVLNTDSSGVVQYQVSSAANTPTLDVYVYGFVLEL